MTRFSGLVGYNLGTQEVRPGVWENVIEEKLYLGEVKTPARQASEETDRLHKSISVSASIEIVADEFALNNFEAIKYVHWMGRKWDVETLEVRHPRLVLRLGGIYNGPTPAAVTP
jgi:hypothetical protein